MSNSIGLFGISEDHIQDYQSLDKRFIKSKSSTFFFEAANDAMFPFIQKLDVLIVDRSINPISNHIIIAALDGEMICRRIFFQDKKVILTCDNSQYKKIFLELENDFIVWGVVKAIARDILW